MNNLSVMPKKTKQLQKMLTVIITVVLVAVLFSISKVSAYYTSGADGRNLEVVPGFSVQQLLAPAGTACREQQPLRSFTGVTIHETSNWSSGADARMHAFYLLDGGRNYDVSWHYVVDNTTAYQCIPESEKSWHAGDTANGVGNASTISIEICDNAGGNFDQAMANAEWLAADVLYRHGVYSVDSHLFQHHDFSAFGKNCPITIRDTGRWPEFCAKTQIYLNQMVAENGSFRISSTNGDIIITGTPSNAAFVSRVDFYVDNAVWVGSAPLAPDGQFSYTIDASRLPAGWHVFGLAAIKNDGSAKWSSYSYLVGPASQMYIENPKASNISYGDVTVSGWTISHAGIVRVDFYADNLLWLGSTSNFYERPDVNNALNSKGLYKNALQSGFSFVIPSSMLSEGNHVIYEVAISNDGTAQWGATSVTIGPRALLCIDQPGSGEIGGDITVSGWAVSVKGLSQVDFYVDDKALIGSTSVLYPRSDVNSIINTQNQYMDALNSEFCFTIDASLLTPGTHLLKVAAISKDGTVQWAVRQFTVGPAPVMCLDSPQSITYNGDISVSGWALSHAGISRVDIYVDDNRWVGSTSNIYERNDVNDIINCNGQYKDARNSGFSYTIDASFLVIGTHVIKVAAISKDGSVQWAFKEFVVGPAPLMSLDSPHEMEFSDSIVVIGWAVSHAGVSRVDIYVDNNQWVGSTSDISNRTDVNSIINVNGQYKDALHSGFCFMVDADRLAVGQHIIQVAAISKDGTVQWSTKEFTVKPKMLKN